MAILLRPTCPHCQQAHTRVVKTIPNIIRVAFSTLIGIFTGEIVSVLWYCADDGHVFRAIGERVIEKSVTQNDSAHDHPPST